MVGRLLDEFKQKTQRIPAQNLGGLNGNEFPGTTSDADVFNVTKSTQDALLRKQAAKKNGSMSTAAGADEVYRDRVEEIYERIVESVSRYQLQQEITRLENSIVKDKEQIKEYIRQERDFETKIAAERVIIKNLEEVIIPQHRKAVKAADEKVEKIEKEIVALNEENKNYGERARQARKEIKEITAEIGQTTKDLSAGSDLAKAASDHDALKKALVEKIKKGLDEKNTSQILPKQDEEETLQTTVMSKEYSFRGEPLSKLVAAGVLTQHELDDFVKQDSDLHKTMKESRERFDAATEKVSKLGDKIDVLKQHEETALFFIDRNNKKIEKLKEELRDATEEQIKADKALQEKIRQLDESTERVKNWNSDLALVRQQRKTLELVVETKSEILEKTKKLEEGEITPSEFIYGKKGANGEYIIPPIKDPDIQNTVKQKFEERGIKITDPEQSAISAGFSSAYDYLTGNTKENTDKNAVVEAAKASTQDMIKDAEKALPVADKKTSATKEYFGPSDSSAQPSFRNAAVGPKPETAPEATTEVVAPATPNKKNSGLNAGVS